jgi:hypothetical protein
MIGTMQRPMSGLPPESGQSPDPCGLFGGSFCISSGHSLSTTARISSEIWSMPLLQVCLHHDLIADQAGLIDAALFGHSRRQLFANVVIAAYCRSVTMVSGC